MNLSKFENEKQLSGSYSESSVWLAFLIVAISPIITILYSYIFSSWSWGLMDDLTILNSGNNFVERLYEYSSGLVTWGVFRPIFSFHSAVVYTIFENSPKNFYIFKLFEICALLYIWGTVAFKLTRKKIALLLVPVVTLSFHYFYDMFFFLSSHEYLGLIFLGLALLLFAGDATDRMRNSNTTSSKRVNVFSFLLGVLFLVCSYGSKETFVSCGVAVGFSYLGLAYVGRKKGLLKSALVKGLFLIIFTVLYGLALKMFIKSSYTSDFSFTNFPKIYSNLLMWVKKDFLNHLPWVLGVFVLIVNEIRSCGSVRKSLLNFSFGNIYGLIVGVSLYFGFLLMLLPWNTVSYYAGPLGLFFGFIVTLLVSNCMSKIPKSLLLVVVIGAMLLNMLVCSYALNREATYQSDTINLMHSLQRNLVSGDEGSSVFTNAMEPGTAIPGLINRKNGSALKQFKYSSNMDEIIEPDNSFYLYSPRFPKIGLSVFQGWEVLFYSKSWVLYRKPLDFVQKER